MPLISMMRLRAKRAVLQVVEVGSLISSIKQLMELHGWVKGNKTLTCLIERLITEKTSLTTEDLQKYTQKVYSGSFTHRLPCPAMRKGGMANQNLNTSSFYSITSDTALVYSKGSINYTICFQSCFLYGLSYLAHTTQLDITLPKQMGLLFTCPSCTWVISEETFLLPEVLYKGVQVKAIHLEVVSDLTSDGFIAALRRFAARRGIPEHIYSDCYGTVQCHRLKLSVAALDRMHSPNFTQWQSC